MLTVIIQNIFKKDSYIPQKNEECPQTTLGRGPRSSGVSHSLTNTTKISGSKDWGVLKLVQNST